MRPRLSPWLALPAGLALLVAAVAQQAPLGSVPIVVSLTNLLARLPSSNAPAALVLGATNAFDWGAPRLIVWDAASSATANGSNTWATASGVGRWRWWEVAGSVDLSGYARLDATNSWSALQQFSQLEFETLVLPGPWAVGVGGTGGTNAAQARANLGADNAANLTQGTLEAARLPATVTLDAEAAAAYQAKSTVLDQFAALVGQSGDVAYHDGSGWVRRPLGTNGGGIVYDVEVGPFLTTNATAVALLTNTIPADTTRSLRLEVLGAGSPTSGVSVARSLVALARQSGSTLALSTNPAPARGLSGTGTTTNATALTLATASLERDALTYAKAEVIGGGPTNGGAYELRGAYANRAGTVTTVGTNNAVTLESTAGLHSWLEVSGTNLLLRVQGVADETLRWRAEGGLRSQVLGTNVAAATGTPDNNLIVHYKFNAGSGTNLTDETGTYPGWLYGAYWTNNTPSGSGYALVFDGTDDYARSSNSIAYGTNKITASFWVKAASWSNDDDIVLESSASLISNYDTFGFYPNNSSPANKMTAVIRRLTGYRIENANPPTAGSWTHFVVVYDHSSTNGDVKIFVNGIEQSLTSTQNTEGANDFGTYILYFMSRGGSSLFEDAWLDDFRIYGGELSQTEIDYLYANPQ